MNKRQRKKMITKGLNYYFMHKKSMIQDVLMKRYDETDKEFIKRVTEKYI